MEVQTGTMRMGKRWRLLIAIGALLGVLAFHRSIPNFVWVSVANLIFTYIVSLFFSLQLPVRCRLGTALLILIGITYLVPALLGFDQAGALVEDNLWNFLISPYLLVSVFRAGYLQPDLPASHRAYDFVPEHEHYLFSIFALGASIAAIVGAVLMAKANRIGFWIWILLLSISTVSFFSYIYVGLVSWGIKEIRIQILWEAIYVGSFLAACQGQPTTNSEVFTRAEEW